MRKIIYIYSGGRKERLNEINNGNEAPLEFLFGLPYLKTKYSADIIELNDLNPDKQSRLYKYLEKKNFRLNQRTFLTSSSHFFISDIEKLNSYDLIIASNEYIALGLLEFKKKGTLKTRMIFFVMGMMAIIYKIKKSTTLYHYLFKNDYKYGEKVYGNLIKNSESVIFLGKGELDIASSIFKKDKHKFHFLPYCIDTDFWRPLNKFDSKAPYILFMGNDSNRDYDLVIKIAIKLKQIKFKFITSKIKRNIVPNNVELLEGDWKKIVYTDAQIRDFIQNCSLVILPLKETFQPSGQSVALQSMACGKTVIISKNEGFWDPDNFLGNQHIIFIDQNSVDNWAELILNTLKNTILLKKISLNSRKLIEKNYNLNYFGQQLEKIIQNKL